MVATRFTLLMWLVVLVLALVVLTHLLGHPAGTSSGAGIAGHTAAVLRHP